MKSIPIQWLCRVIDGAIHRISTAAAWLNAALIVVIILQVALRYLFGKGLVVLEELQWHLYAVAFMIGIVVNRLYKIMHSWILVALPMFIFMGLMLGGLYVSYILGYAYLHPAAAPLAKDRPAFQMRMVWQVLLTVVPPALLIAAVLGSIFMGMATPTEASGVGAMGAILLALVNRRLTTRVFHKATMGTFKTTAYIFSILVGATCFALVLRALGGDEVIHAIFSGLPFGPYGVIAVILGGVFLLGFFLDWIEISLVVLPLVAPIVSSLGLEIDGHGTIDDPILIWFTILVAVSLQTSFLTPPVGFSIFYLKGVAPEQIGLMDMYRGVVPFIVLQLIGLTIVALFPQLVV